MLSILLVDDTPLAYKDLLAVFTSYGDDVTIANSLPEAMDKLTDAHQSGRLFDFLMSDYELGNRQTGADVYQCAWRTGMGDTPFIASSSKMENWTLFQTKMNLANLYPQPKVLGRWDVVKVPHLVNAIQASRAVIA